MISIKDFKAGDIVIIYNTYYKSTQPATVEKVGVKYVTTTGGWPRQFSKPDYICNANYLVEKSKTTAEELLFKSEEDLQDYLERIELIHWIRFDLKYHTLSLNQLREIKEISERKEG